MPVPPAARPGRTLPVIGIEALARALALGADLIDVRTAVEYADGHIPGARLLPLDRLDGDLDRGLGALPAGRPLYVVCRSGGRSSVAVTALRGLGVDAVLVAGGVYGWIADGRTLATGSCWTEHTNES